MDHITDSAGFSEFFMEYRPRFIRFAAGYLHDSQLAEDFVVDSMMVFCAAINGEFDGYAACPAREDWFAYRDNDTAMALLHSFGNDRSSGMPRRCLGPL